MPRVTRRRWHRKLRSSGNRFTKYDDAIIIQNVTEGRPTTAFKRLLPGRTKDAIDARIRRLKLPSRLSTDKAPERRHRNLYLEATLDRGMELMAEMDGVTWNAWVEDAVATKIIRETEAMNESGNDP